jgi:rubrerythrin
MAKISKSKGVDSRIVGDAPGPEINFQCFDALKVSLCIEKEGLSFYERAGKAARDPEVKDMFARLADEEREHIRCLQEKAKYLQPALSRKAESHSVEQFIARRLKGKVFPAGKGRGWESPEFHTDAEALRFGIESEKRSIQALSELVMMERKIDVRAIFQHLMVEEKKHLSALEELQTRMTKKAAQ